MRLEPGWMLIIMACWAITSGATCVPRGARQAPLAPTVFNAPPRLEELVYHLNEKTRRVQALHCDAASISTTGMPSLRATISLERPRRFRLRGRLIGPEIDLGSNDQIVWFWAGSDPQRAVYLARHERLAATPGIGPIPIEAEWLIQAFGLVELMPHDQHSGPYPRRDGTLEIRSQLLRPSGMLTQSIVVDARYGWVTEQSIRNGQGQLLARIQAGEHRYYPEADVALPHRIQIELPTAQLSFQIESGPYRLNQLLDDPRELWEMPAFEGYRRIDLADTPLRPGSPLNGSSLAAAPAYDRTDRTSYRPRVRGYSR